MEWLGSVGRESEPKLLYRASRDGWDTEDFHDKCDGKGATVVLVKSEGGYVFGGYTDVSWASSGGEKYSSESFLFSLKCHAGLPAVKMGIKAGYESSATYLSPDYGLTFGSGYDLCIGSNANTNTNDRTYCYVGSTYHFPHGTTDPNFFTGSETFRVAEYEVFQV